MKKIIFVLLLLSIIATPSYALSFMEKIKYKEVLLTYTGYKVLVDRYTGEVKYLWNEGIPGNSYWPSKWGALSGEQKQNFQRQYDQQNAPR